MQARTVSCLAGLLLLLSPLPGLAQAPTAAASPGRDLVVGISEAPPFAIRTAEKSWEGLSVDLWKRIADRLQLGYRFAEMPTIESLLIATGQGRLDAALSAITVTAARAKLVDFTQPYVVTGVGIAVPAHGSAPWAALRRTFLSFGFLQAVAALVTLVVTIGGIVWLLERRHTRHYGGKRGLGSGIWWSALAMTQSGAASNPPRTLPGRVLAVVWMIASIVTIAIFTAGLTSTLTKRELQGNVQSPGDLRTARVGVIAGFAWQDYIARQQVRARPYSDLASGMKAIQSNQLDAFIHDKPQMQWAVLQGFSSTVRVLDMTLGDQVYAIALPADSPLRRQIDDALLEIVESDWWRLQQFKYLGQP